MSVMYLNPEIYQDCEHTLQRNFTTNGSEKCLFNYLDYPYYGNDNLTPFQRLFNELYNLNALSYANRYKEDFQQPMQLDFLRGKELNDWQLLKALECIDYQIEINNNLHVQDLKRLINDLKNRLIGLIPDYKNAKWCY